MTITNERIEKAARAIDAARRSLSSHGRYVSSEDLARAALEADATTVSESTNHARNGCDEPSPSRPSEKSSGGIAAKQE